MFVAAVRKVLSAFHDTRNLQECFLSLGRGLLARISHELRFELAADCADYADGALACSGRLNGLCVRHPRLLKSFDKKP